MFMENPPVGAELRQIAQERGLSQKEMAEILGISPQSLNNWIKRGIPAAQIFDVSKRLGVPVVRLLSSSPVGLYEPTAGSGSFLAGLAGGRHDISNAEILDEGMDIWGDDSPLPDDEIELPFLKEVELSAGDGRTAVEMAGTRKLRFGKHTVRKHGVQPDNAVCVLVKGRSMEPVLRDGATVAVDRGKCRITDVADGDMYAISHDGQVRVKQLYRLPRGGLRLRSFNRQDHEDEDLTVEDIQEQNVQIIGRVFWSASFF